MSDDHGERLRHLEERVEKLEKQVWCNHRWTYDPMSAGPTPMYRCTACGLRSTQTMHYSGMAMAP